jgi:hypothetical protein
MIRFYDEPSTAFLLGQLAAQAEREREDHLAVLLSTYSRQEN